MLILKNIRLLRTVFVLLVFILFLASCKNKKELANTSITNTSTTPKKSENAVKSSFIIDKYSTQLKVEPKDIDNVKLYSFIDEWYAVPYKYAGYDKSGIDCSGFSCKLYETVYSKKIARASKDIYASCKEIDQKNLKEGDFVFFKIESKNVSHVGVYLQNNKFVHASTKKGIIINDLNEPYYKKYFYTGGRIK